MCCTLERLIDTSDSIFSSGVERFLGQAIEDSGVDRSEVFLTTKLWPKDYGFHSAYEAAIASINRLNTDYLDLVRMKIKALKAILFLSRLKLELKPSN